MTQLPSLWLDSINTGTQGFFKLTFTPLHFRIHSHSTRSLDLQYWSLTHHVGDFLHHSAHLCLSICHWVLTPNVPVAGIALSGPKCVCIIALFFSCPHLQYLGVILEENFQKTKNDEAQRYKINPY